METYVNLKSNKFFNSNVNPTNGDFLRINTENVFNLKLPVWQEIILEDHRLTLMSDNDQKIIQEVVKSSSYEEEDIFEILSRTNILRALRVFDYISPGITGPEEKDLIGRRENWRYKSIPVRIGLEQYTLEVWGLHPTESGHCFAKVARLSFGDGVYSGNVPEIDLTDSRVYWGKAIPSTEIIKIFEERMSYRIRFGFVPRCWYEVPDPNFVESRWITWEELGRMRNSSFARFRLPYGHPKRAGGRRRRLKRTV